MDSVAAKYQENDGIKKVYLTPEIRQQLEEEYNDLVSDMRFGIEQYTSRADYLKLVSSVNRLQRFKISKIETEDVYELSLNLAYIYTATNLGGIVKKIANAVVNSDPYILELRDKSTHYDKTIAKNIVERFKESRFLTDEQKMGIDILKDIDGMPVLMCKDFDEMSKQNQEFAEEYVPIAINERRKADEKFKSSDEEGWQ